MSNSNLPGRRHFARLLATAAGSAALPTLAATTTPAAGALHAPLIKPPRLREGDVVGLIAPSGLVDEAMLDKSIRNIESLGCKAKLATNVRAARGSYAGTVSQRLDDLHAMFADASVNAVWAVRGGSGLSQLLPSIRYDLIRRHPKILVGYSDITALHLALLRHSALVSFHGPVASSTFSDYSVEHLRAVLMTPLPQYTMTLDPQAADKSLTATQYARRTYNHGVAVGRLTGGNLSVVSTLVGTDYAADFRHAIAFLEDVKEAPYRIDRMLTHLELSPGFRSAAALMLGVFEGSDSKRDDSLTLAETLGDHLGGLRIPAVSGYSFGHIDRQLTLPLGVKARLDTMAGTLTLLEPAVT
jgi:muramoyltetrapeptide carboxypeptidase